ncbi:uncharacterized protein LOC113351251 [Papaver somniferum]|uniref:uncharacterized protein LOC113351251 n=1 Tax=Papaver somniferum TaxID=3469 RepID=UPI000E6FEC12|nr:uncharacterized protein LOC113351251 [Papaver somniferum]
MPTFDAARSQLRNEEIRRSQHSIAASPTALAAASSPTNRPSSRSHPHSSKRGQKAQSGDRRSGPIPSTSSTAIPPLLPTPTGLRPFMPGYPPYWPPFWVVPPCPYPTQSPWQPFEHQCRPPSTNFRNNQRVRSPGSGRGQAYLAPIIESLQPADIAEAYSSMHLQQPDDAFHMDTGATSHLTADSATLHNVFNSSNVRSILVGNGNSILVTASGTKLITLPSRTLQLKKSLVVPDIIKNLIYVRKFTTDNRVSVEFDPSGFSAKDLSSRKIILRYDSSGELYPITSPVVPPTKSSQSSPISLAVFSPDIWHSRLDHPGKAILDVLPKIILFIVIRIILLNFFIHVKLVNMFDYHFMNLIPLL